MSDATVKIGGETLLLMPERAIFWERQTALLIADPHFGKSATFRARHVPIPEGDLALDLARLTSALERTGAETLIVLGDLIHAAAGRDAATIGAVCAWRETHNARRVLLVRGNHDRSAGDPPAEWQLDDVVDAPHASGPFILSHHPGPSAEGYVLAGHLHPLVQLTGKGRQMLNLPCFWFGKAGAVLPAFGSFIDGAVIRPASEDRVFAIAGEAIFAVGCP